MTATNHALTGAAIAVLVDQPILAIIFAVLSHFALDALPHFGIHEDDVPRRNRHWLFRTVVTTDILVTIVLVVCLPFSIHSQPRWLLDTAMLAAIAPDAIWIAHFVQERRTGVWPADGPYARWHQKIQWHEKPWAISVEACWAVLMVAAVRLI